MALAVVGAGFGRTGTNSLKLALEQLGFGPCHHMLEVVDRPDRIGFWAAAGRGERRDWDTVFTGFGSTVDWPSTYFWREIAAHYPRAKIILSHRPDEQWLGSIRATIFTSLKRWQERPEGPPRDLGRMAYELIVERTFSGRIDDDAHVLSVYRAHNEAVKRAIAPDRLLVYDIAEGWEPLCRFLDVAVPTTPIPRTNSTEEFIARGRARGAAREAAARAAET